MKSFTARTLKIAAAIVAVLTILNLIAFAWLKSQGSVPDIGFVEFLSRVVVLTGIFSLVAGAVITGLWKVIADAARFFRGVQS